MNLSRTRRLAIAARRPRCRATTRAAPPRDKGLRYPADPPTVEQIVAVMRAAGDGPEGARLRALIVILWCAGLRIGEALDLVETDLDRARGAVLVRRGKGGRGRDVGMDRWGWAQLEPWLQFRTGLRAGALLCVIRGATAGRHWEQSAARKQLQRSATLAGVRRRFAPHQLRHARRRDGSRGRPAGRDPAPARACPPRDHIDLSAGRRQRRDHRHGPLQAGTRDLGHRRPTRQPIAAPRARP